MLEIIEINNTSTYVLKNKHNVDIETLIINKDIISISLVSCKIRKIPRNFFERFTKLESIDLYDNYLESVDFIVPNSVTNMNLSYNMIEKFEINTLLSEKLEYVDLRYNKLTESPSCLTNIRKNLEGNNFSYQNYIIKNNFRPQQEDPRQAVPRHVVISKNIPNVHDTHIQTNTMKSIEILINSYDSEKYNPNFMLEIKQYLFSSKFNYKFNKYLNPFGRNMKFINELKYYHTLNSDIVYNYVNYKTCKIYQMIERVWNFAKTSEYKISVIENMIIQVLDGKWYCFVGKYTRLINTIVAFHKNMAIHIPFSEKFSNELNKMGGVKNEKSLEHMEKFVKDSGIKLEDKEIWLNAIKEFFEEELNQIAVE